MLPSGYIPLTGLRLTYGSYINTGVNPSSTFSIDALFSGASNYVFGARNSNSNTSAGQTNLYAVQGATSYFGYQSARLSLSSNLLDLLGFLHVHTELNEIEVVNANAYIVSVTGSTSSFTGTRPMYIGAMNNGGSVSTSGACCLHGFKIYDGDLIHDFVPCFEASTSKYGVYDTVTNTFISPTGNISRTMYLVDVSDSVGGQSYIETLHGDKVKQVYAGNGSMVSGYTYAHFIAVADPGYTFQNWTDSNGNVVSTESDFEYAITQADTFTPNFIKATELDANHSFMAMGILYGENRNASFRDDFYTEVISASIKTDTMQKTTSTITVKEVPSVYQPNMPIVIFNPKGRVVYLGVIQSIDNNVLTCREPLAVYDDDFLFHVNTSLMNGVNLTTHSVLYGIENYMDWVRTRNTDNGIGDVNLLQQRKLYPFVAKYNPNVALDENRVFNVRLPKIDEANIANLEDYIMSMFDSFGIYVRTRLMSGKRNGLSLYDSHYFEMMPRYIKDFDTLELSDNVENIQNVSINIEEAESTVLVVYNSSGASVRNYYGMKNDGSIKKFDGSTLESELADFIGYNNYRVKVVSSDDDLAVLKAQNLSNSLYNHKITFDLGMDGKLFDIDSLKLGQPVNFYYKDKMYQSVITGISFEINANDEKIHSINVTMGKVRTSLTSKLNLKKL